MAAEVVFGVVAGAVGLTFQIAKLIAEANRLNHKYKELEPNVRKLNSTLVSLKAIVACLDTHTPLLPGEFVNGVLTELINGLKEDIDRATQIVDRINNSSGIARKLRKTISKYSKEIDKVSSDFKVSLLVLIAFQVRDIKDDISHIRARTKETTEGRISRLIDFLRKYRGKYGGTGGTRSYILTNLTGLFPDSLKKMEIRLKNLLKIHGLSRESDGIETEHKATEEEVTVTEEDDGETTCGACRKCYGFAEYRIEFNICEKWFHGTCVLITPDTAEQHFRCRACSH